VTLALTPLERSILAKVADSFAPKPPKPRRWATPGDMARELDPTVVQTPALDLIDDALVDLADGVGQQRLAIFMSPQEGKSERASHWFPLWALTHNPDLRIAVVSHEAELARGWGAAIKRDVEYFNGDEGNIDLGIQLRTDSKAVGRWNIEGHRGGVYCVGIGGSLTGRPVDLLVLDDPISNLEQAQSIKYRERAHRFWQGVAVPRMGPQTKTILIQTRWHEDDLAGRLLATEGDRAKGGKWRVVSIPAQCEDEATDPLGRRQGEYMISTRGRTRQDWEDRKADLGAYVWAALCQQRPSPAEGGLFKRLWFRWWTPGVSFTGRESVNLAGRDWPLDECWRFITGDLAASTRTSADWTVAAAWALTINGDLVLLDYNRAKVGEANHYDLFRPLAERWAVDTAFIEATQHSMTLTAEASRSGLHVTPLKADNDKFSRALPYSARCSGGRVWLPAGSPKMDVFVAEHASFPNGAHDDLVDAGAYAVRVAVTKWQPPPPRPPVQPARDDFAFLGSGVDVDFMTVSL
jgi:predicted phage terminase large subunit-like protein